MLVSVFGLLGRVGILSVGCYVLNVDESRLSSLSAKKMDTQARVPEAFCVGCLKGKVLRGRDSA